MDGQQWVWVAMVLLGAALVAAVMFFGRERRNEGEGRQFSEHREPDAGLPSEIDDFRG